MFEQTRDKHSLAEKREIQFGRAEKYRLLRGGSWCGPLDDRVSESQTRVAGVYNSLATQRPCHGQNY